MIIATNKATGEVVELETDTLDQVVAAWRTAQEYIKLADSLKAQLQRLVPSFVNEQGISEEVNNYMFKTITVQRKNYDKATIARLVEDEDLRYQMLKPDKGFIDTYLKENIETTGDMGTILRNTMVEDGKAYQYYKLEKLSREES